MKTTLHHALVSHEPRPDQYPFVLVHVETAFRFFLKLFLGNRYWRRIASKCQEVLFRSVLLSKEWKERPIRKFFCKFQTIPKKRRLAIPFLSFLLKELGETWLKCVVAMHFSVNFLQGNGENIRTIVWICQVSGSRLSRYFTVTFDIRLTSHKKGCWSWNRHWKVFAFVYLYLQNNELFLNVCSG